ncbi:hypothetical protein BD310DRAFT_494438 [Dichomitus squalens]|uniref:Uncharacterized protein n=1 Tax=Dichomitus squalens TaxID=114155 RepID=A0A4Q9PUM3_9APHY|nr:hypothetical protein BD310DRAFT_494438 [Dichomitus squalens]
MCRMPQVTHGCAKNALARSVCKRLSSWVSARAGLHPSIAVILTSAYLAQGKLCYAEFARTIGLKDRIPYSGGSGSLDSQDKLVVRLCTIYRQRSTPPVHLGLKPSPMRHI